MTTIDVLLSRFEIEVSYESAAEPIPRLLEHRGK
jgi:hypothetical protein